MDGRGGCCIARYGGSGGGGGYDMSKVDRIMLRFRPIAPKPMNGGSSSPEMSEVSTPKSSRGKRSRACNNNNNNNKNNNKSQTRCNSNGIRMKKKKSLNEEAVTLPLLPETPERRIQQSRDDLVPRRQGWLSFGNHDYYGNLSTSANRVTVTKKVVWSCVTVQCLTDTWVNVDGLGLTDVEMRMNLASDTCPGFMSDGFGRVAWTNEAYRKMVGVSEGGEVVVWLAMDNKTVSWMQRAFTCRVRVHYGDTCQLGNKEGKGSITVPCDVWGMENGGFAWRLDVKAALCLGR